jgi:hypothetical protein
MHPGGGSRYLKTSTQYLTAFEYTPIRWNSQAGANRAAVPRPKTRNTEETTFVRIAARITSLGWRRNDPEKG